MSDQLWRLNRVMEETGLCRSSIYDKMAKGEFPNNIKIGPQMVAWPSSQVESWKQEQISKAA